MPEGGGKRPGYVTTGLPGALPPGAPYRTIAARPGSKSAVCETCGRFRPAIRRSRPSSIDRSRRIEVGWNGRPAQRLSTRLTVERGDGHDANSTVKVAVARIGVEPAPPSQRLNPADRSAPFRAAVPKPAPAVARPRSEGNSRSTSVAGRLGFPRPLITFHPANQLDQRVDRRRDRLDGLVGVELRLETLRRLR